MLLFNYSCTAVRARLIWDLSFGILRRSNDLGTTTSACDERFVTIDYTNIPIHVDALGWPLARGYSCCLNVSWRWLQSPNTIYSI
jgi:hypothetical protein